MNHLSENIKKVYGGKVRIRTCGICISEDTILMIAHSGLAADLVWLPPGGGLDFGIDARTNLKREFLEETGLRIEVDRLLFTCEFIKPPLHSIELFYLVKYISGELRTGYDPETENSNNIIENVQFLSFEKINSLSTHSKHRIFSHCKSLVELLNLKGYFLFDE